MNKPIALLLISSFLPLSGFANDGLPTPCTNVLRHEDEMKFLKKRAVDLRNGVKFTDESRNFFKTQREHFRSLAGKANMQLVEMEQPFKRMVTAMMLETHAYAFGPPGGAKSHLTDMLLGTPQEEKTGAIAESFFQIQFNPQLGDYPFRGYLNKEGKLQADGTMLSSKYAKFDEIDKGTGNSLAGILDLLNERKALHGSIAVPAQLKTAIATSNMTTYEFLESFRAQGMESTGKALLDRLPFKIYVHNYPTNEAYIADAIRSASDRSANKAEDLLMGFFRDAKKTEVVKDDIDFSWFGAMSKRLFYVEDSSISLYKDVISKMKDKVKGKRLRSAQELADDPALDKNGYYPTTIFSMRNIMNYTKDVVGASLMYDLPTLPENVLPTETLIAMMEKGFELPPESAWRLQDVMLTTTSAAPELLAEEGRLSLKFGPELEELKKGSGDKRELELLKDIQEEQTYFSEAFESSYDEMKKANQSVGEISSDFLDLLGGSPTQKTKVRNIEEWLIQVGQK